MSVESTLSIAFARSFSSIYIYIYYIFIYIYIRKAIVIILCDLSKEGFAQTKWIINTHVRNTWSNRKRYLPAIATE